MYQDEDLLKKDKVPDNGGTLNEKRYIAIQERQRNDLKLMLDKNYKDTALPPYLDREKIRVKK